MSLRPIDKDRLAQISNAVLKTLVENQVMPDEGITFFAHLLGSTIYLAFTTDKDREQGAALACDVVRIAATSPTDD